VAYWKQLYEQSRGQTEAISEDKGYLGQDSNLVTPEYMCTELPPE
jgi:hypothetical protein